MSKKISRNDLCFCGSGKKYKYCCLLKISNFLFPRPGGIDPISKFLEEYLGKSFNIIRYYFHLEYSKIFIEWTNDSIHSQSVYATDKCKKLAIIAERKISKIVSLHPRRLWIDALRRTDLHVLWLIYGIMSLNGLIEYLKTCTLAICKFSKIESSSQSVISNHLKDVLSPTEETYAKKNFAKNFGRLLGAVHALVHAQTSYRYAGKGGKVLKPETYPIENFPKFDKFPHNAIFILPCINYEKDDILENDISFYEKRRDQQHNTGVTGFYPQHTSIILTKSNWWSIGILSDFPKFFKIKVSYPSIQMEIFNNSFLVLPRNNSNELKQLLAFADNFERVFGFNFDSFRLMCQSLANYVYSETSFSELTYSKVSNDYVEFNSKLMKNSSMIESSPIQLYNLFARALFKSSKSDLVKVLSNNLIGDSIDIAKKFIDEFTFKPQELLSHDLNPWLFYPIYKEIIAIDFLNINSFIELCLRKLTSGNGQIPNQRADIFEKQTREYLIQRLQLEKDQIPIKPNEKIKIGENDYGDYDFAFIYNETLINLDMKSWQKKFEYLKGDFSAVNNRLLDLQKQLDVSNNITKRGKLLLDKLRNTEKWKNLKGVLSFIVVPHVEFLSSKMNELWYEKLPRIILPNELVNFLNDKNKFDDLISTINF